MARAYAGRAHGGVRLRVRPGRAPGGCADVGRTSPEGAAHQPGGARALPRAGARCRIPTAAGLAGHRSRGLRRAAAARGTCSGHASLSRESRAAGEAGGVLGLGQAGGSDLPWCPGARTHEGRGGSQCPVRAAHHGPHEADGVRRLRHDVPAAGSALPDVRRLPGGRGPLTPPPALPVRARATGASGSLAPRRASWWRMATTSRRASRAMPGCSRTVPREGEAAPEPAARGAAQPVAQG